MRDVERAVAVQPEEAVLLRLLVVEGVVDADVGLHRLAPLVRGAQVHHPEARALVRLGRAVQVVALAVGVVVELGQVLRAGVGGAGVQVPGACVMVQRKRHAVVGAGEQAALEVGGVEAVLVALEAGREGKVLAKLAEDLPLFATTALPVSHREPVRDVLRESLAEITPDTLTPREALELLYRLKGLMG